jgi:hypothetical protein
MIYPNSNLPTVSQPWGRAVQKGLETLEATVKSNDVNNKARDAQLQNSYVQVNKSVQDIKFAVSQAGIAIGGVNEITSNIYVPGTTKINGTTIQTGTLSATTINGGTINSTVSITGSLIKSSGTGARIEISGTSLRVYNATLEDPVASIYGDSMGFFINGGNGSYVGIGSGSVSLDAGTSGLVMQDTGTVINGTVDIMDALNVYGTFETYGLLDVYGGLTLSSTSTFNDAITMNAQLTISSPNRLVVPYAYTQTTTSATNMFIGSNGNIIRSTTTSSRRFKNSIRDFVFDVDAFMAIKPVKFKYNEGIITDPDQKDWDILGFIAEDFVDAGLDEVVTFDNEGQVSELRYDKLVMLLHGALAQQNERIKALENK